MAFLRYYYGDKAETWSEDKQLQVFCELIYVKKTLGEWKFDSK